MKHRILGRTGIEVSELGLGGLFLGREARLLSGATATVATAVGLGVNYIDTAPRYGDSERVLGVALQDVSSPIVISTKVGGRPSPGVAAVAVAAGGG